MIDKTPGSKHLILTAANTHTTTNYRPAKLICELGPPTQVPVELPIVGRIFYKDSKDH